MLLMNAFMLSLFFSSHTSILTFVSLICAWFAGITISHITDNFVLILLDFICSFDCELFLHGNYFSILFSVWCSRVLILLNFLFHSAIWNCSISLGFEDFPSWHNGGCKPMILICTIKEELYIILVKSAFTSTMLFLRYHLMNLTEKVNLEQVRIMWFSDIGEQCFISSDLLSVPTLK